MTPLDLTTTSQHLEEDLTPALNNVETRHTE